MDKLKVKFGEMEFKNPIIAASGTFGFGQEYNDIYDVSILGGISSKGLTLNPKEGNDGARLHETPMGIINSIGLENPGVDGFIKNELDGMRKFNNKVIVNLGGSTEDEYLEGIAKLNQVDLDIIELNISCPNVKAGCMAFGMTGEGAGDIVRKVTDISKHPVVVKLSPNAEDITKVAFACQEAGAYGISLINTIKAMAIDINKRKPVFDNVYAGLSGPAIKPIALRMVHEVSKVVDIPVMGMGGIRNYKDVIEFIMAGAHCVQIGTANFTNPTVCKDIIEDLNEYMKNEKIESLEEIRGII